jgi:small-conductance mechanosensitive channel
MESFIQSLTAILADWIPRIVAALAILLIGWIIAKIVAAIIRRLLRWLKLDARLSKGLESAAEQPVSVESLIVQVAYYLIIFLAVLGALNALGMTQITALFSSMLNQIFLYLPRVIYAAILALIALFVARLLRAIVTRVLSRAGVDKRVSEPAGMAPAPISSAIGEAVYWIVWLLFLPAILSVLGLAGILLPIQAMLTSLLSALPSLLAAAIIIIVGLFIARVLQRIVASALHAFGADALAERVGVAKYLGKPNLSGLIGYLVYIIVLIPIVIAALNVTGLTFLAAPLSAMLNQVLLAIPKFFMAGVVLAIAFLIGRVLADAVTTLLQNAGFDGLVARLSLGEVSETPSTSPSKVVGWVVLALIMLFGALAAASMIGWTAMVLILEAFVAFLARLLIGLLILVIGIYLANLATKLILSTGLAQRQLLALLARVAIIVFAVAMALDQIGIANDIVNMAFGLILAGAALAAALAFGLGGQDVAKYQLVRMYKSAGASLATPPAPEAELKDTGLDEDKPEA